MVGFFQQREHLRQRVAELLRRHAGIGFHVEHRNQVLLGRQTLYLEIVQLLPRVNLRTEEMIAAHLQVVVVRQLDVAQIERILVVAALSTLQVDIGHVGIVAHGIPEHLILIVAHVDAVHMGTGVLAGMERVGVVYAQLHLLGHMLHSSASTTCLTAPRCSIADNAHHKAEKKEKKYLFHHIIS